MFKVNLVCLFIYALSSIWAPTFAETRVDELINQLSQELSPEGSPYTGKNKKNICQIEIATQKDLSYRVIISYPEKNLSQTFNLNNQVQLIDSYDFERGGLTDPYVGKENSYLRTSVVYDEKEGADYGETYGSLADVSKMFEIKDVSTQATKKWKVYVGTRKGASMAFGTLTCTIVL